MNLKTKKSVARAFNILSVCAQSSAGSDRNFQTGVVKKLRL